MANPILIMEEQSDDSDSDDTLPVANLPATSPRTSTCPSQVCLWIMHCTIQFSYNTVLPPMEKASEIC